MSDLWVWVAPDGSETILTTLRGKKGVHMPVYTIHSNAQPDGLGARLAGVAAQPRAVDVPVRVFDANPDLLRAKIRSLAHALNSRNGDGRLKVVRSDGTTRILACRYKGGLDQPTRGDRYIHCVLSFEASDPLWYASEAISDEFSIGGATTPFFPFFPLVVLQSAVFTGQIVTNPGDESSWPIWEIYGPGDTLVIDNLTTGMTLSVGCTLAESDMLVIDTRPGHKTVELNGENAFDLIQSSGRALWSLQPGNNEVKILLNNADGASLVRCTFTPNYMGA